MIDDAAVCMLKVAGKVVVFKASVDQAQEMYGLILAQVFANLNRRGVHMAT